MAIANTLEGEIFRRRLQKDYAAYVQYANPGFCMTKFHRYLCGEIQEFLDMPPTGKAMDILLLSVPPQHGKSYTVTPSGRCHYMFLRRHYCRRLQPQEQGQV